MWWSLSEDIFRPALNRPPPSSKMFCAITRLACGQSEGTWLKGRGVAPLQGPQQPCHLPPPQCMGVGALLPCPLHRHGVASVLHLPPVSCCVMVESQPQMSNTLRFQSEPIIFFLGPSASHLTALSLGFPIRKMEAFEES
jgi:hypothetical protein